MDKLAKKSNNISSQSRRTSNSFFKIAGATDSFLQTKLNIGSVNDHFEREADQIADRVMSSSETKQTAQKSTFFSSAAVNRVQREEKDESSAVISEGASVTYDQLKEQPGVETWKEQQTKALSYRVWGSQSSEFKAGIVGFGLGNLGLLGTAFALDPRFRSDSIDFLQDKNLLIPLSLLPYSEYFPVSSFKYKLPTAENSPYTFQTEFSLDELSKLALKSWNIPKVSLGVGVDSSYSQEQGFNPITGGKVKLKFGGGIVNFSAFYNQTLPPTPMLISDPGSGESPIWMMRTLPSQLDANLPKGHGVFLTVDVSRLLQLFNPSAHKTESTIQRKEKSNDGDGQSSAPDSVHKEVNSGKGNVFEPHTKTLMENRFGQDFSQVRIHTGSEAAESAHSIDAKAYTSGNHIVFGAGEYQPGTREGQRLLAHELVHVGQQAGIVQRKESHSPSTLVKDLKEKLEEGKYASAYRQLNDFVERDDDEKKNWLSANQEIRFLFLRNLPGDAIADVYSAEELKLRSPKWSFKIIDSWYQIEKEKQALYSNNMGLFDYLLGSISPYTGADIGFTITRLVKSIKAKKKYLSFANNPEFHTIHLLAPSVDRKIKFYAKYKSYKLFKAVKKKFDPFTGISKKIMGILTDTNEVDREKAQEIYSILKKLPEEKRRAFLETASFAGTLEADKDAEKYYRKKYKKQYKALPHNWDFAFFPWNWGGAPFADRLTVDHIALMSSSLFYEDLERRKFGFDKGIESEAGSSINDPSGTRVDDATRLIEQLSSNKNFQDHRRLAILISIAVRAGLEQKVSEIIRAKNAEQELLGPILAVVENYGFVASEEFNYRDDQNKFAQYNDARWWYITKKTLFGGDSGKVVGEQRGTFDLRNLQATSDHKGSLGGLRFGNTVYKNDDYYNNTWLDEAVKASPGSSTLLPNLKETKGHDRRGKIFASIRNDIRQANIFASSLAIEGLNFFSAGTLFRSGRGVIQGLAVHLSWSKETSEPDNSIDLRIDIGNLFLNQFEMVAPDSTLSIGQIGVKGFRVRLAQIDLAASEGLFLGLFKNVDFTLNALVNLMPNVLKLLPYAVMSMIEEFKGNKAHKYKDALGEVLKNEFSSLDASVTFTSMKVRNIYDTAAGFLDDISIEKEKKDGKLVRQEIRIQENQFWTIDALFNLRGRIRTIDEKIRETKAEIADSDLAVKIKKLEIDKESALKAASTEGVNREDRDAEMAKLRVIMPEIRRLTTQLDEQFEQAKKENPRYDVMPFKILEAERLRLNVDLEYIDNQYFEDKKIVEGSSKAVKRFEARKRIEAFEAKYKSVDVRMALRGITLHGGEYLRDLINDAVKSIGFVDPQFKGIENIKISDVNSSFTASGSGVASIGEEAGVKIRGLHLPLLEASALALKSDSLLIEAGKPLLENVYISVAIDFAKNPLDKDPDTPLRYVLKRLYVSKATFNGLTVKVGSSDPLFDFPATMPVQVWGLKIWNYDPDIGNINLKINDVKAQGKFANKDEEKDSSNAVEFGVDTTADKEADTNKIPALDLRYNKKENSITTKVNIASAWIPSFDIRSPTMDIVSLKDTEAARLTNLLAEVKVVFGKEKSEGVQAEPTIIEIRKLHLDKLTVQGITMTLKEVEQKESEETDKAAKAKTIQVVTLPRKDKVTINNIDIKGLRVTLDEEATQLSTIDQNASLHLGESDLGGIHYKQKTARGSVLKSLSLRKGKFESLKLDALNRNDRPYSLKEFFKFFGRTRLHGADIEGKYKAGKTKGTIGIKGKKNIPISIDYEVPKDGKPGYHKIRLPLKRVTVPALHLEKDSHIIDIPKAKSRATRSVLNDVDVKLRVYETLSQQGEAQYDVYLDSLQVGLLKVFGLEYHNKEKGIDVVFDPLKPLHIPNVKAGGFRFSSWKAFDVFGKEGGWLNAAVEDDDIISAHFDSISAELSDGSFLAEKDSATGRSALDIDIASLGFKYDKDGNITVELGKISGGFPKMTISKTDAATGALSSTTLSSVNNKALAAETVTVFVGADKNTVIDAVGLSAGELTITSTETLGKETSISTLKLGPEALGAQSALVKLNADKSKEIIIKDIRGGIIDLDLISTGKKGKSKNFISLPDPEAVVIQELKILIDSKGRKRITIVKPTIKKITLERPNLLTLGDYTKVVTDIVVDGNIELGDGDFDTLTFAEPYNAFVGFIEESVPVVFQNVHLEIQDSAKSAEEKKATDTVETEADRKKLAQLRRERDKIFAELKKIPASIGYGRGTRSNPKHTEVLNKYLAAKKLYHDHKSKLIGAASATVAASLTPNQRKLIELEKERDKAYSNMLNTPVLLTHRPEGIPNPAYDDAAEEYVAADKAYDAHKAKMVAGAKSEAEKSMTRKYLDAVSGKVSGSIKIFGNEIPVNIETYSGELYVEISEEVTDNIKSVIRSLVDTTIDMPFWRSEQMKAIGQGLKRWWLRSFTAPAAKDDVDKIASGHAFDVVSKLLRDIDMRPGKLETDKSLFGINLNIEGYWALDATTYDSIGIGLCEMEYKHLTKKDFYSLYGIVEYLQYVTPTLVSASGLVDQQRLEELAKGFYKSSSEVGDAGVGAAVNELVLFIKSNLVRESQRLKNTVLQNIEGVNITADVSLRPQEVINTLVTEYKAGSFTLDKGKDSIDDVHIQGDYVNTGVPQATIAVGGGAKGTENITIPGATYLSQDKGTKVTYQSLEVAPLGLAYEQNIYQLKTNAAKIKGLKFGLRKKK